MNLPGSRAIPSQEGEHVSRHRELNRVASRQRSLVTLDQLAQCGFSSSGVAREVAAGRLASIEHGVYLVGGVEPDWACALLAATLSTEAPGSHRSSAHVWDLIGDGQPIEVVTGRETRRRLRNGVVHQSSSPPKISIRAGIPVTSPMRALLDIGGLITPQELADAVEVGLLSKLISVKALNGELARVGSRGREGTAALRLVLADRELGDKPSESVLEARAVRLFRPAGLPMPVFQFEVWHDGNLIARLDLAFPRLKIAIEIDGWSSRATSADLRRSTRRRNALTALGWVVLHFTWLDIVQNPDYFVSQIAALLIAQGA
jgi:hypothetical protein